MRLSSGAISDADLATALATGAGQILVGIAHRGLLSGGLVGDIGDAMAQAWISTALRRHRPHDAVLSEEAEDIGNRATSSRVWIIDPLDGTSEFARGTADWAVHIALTIDGEPEVAAVSLPAHGQVFRSDEVPVSDGPLTGKIAVSRYGLAYHSAAVVERLGLTPVRIGSAGAKAMAVVRGDVDAYVHSGGQYEWDNCAPVGVALAAGLHCSRLDGSPIVYNTKHAYMPDFVICRPEIADEVLTAVSTPW